VLRHNGGDLFCAGFAEGTDLRDRNISGTAVIRLASGDTVEMRNDSVACALWGRTDAAYTVFSGHYVGP